MNKLLLTAFLSSFSLNAMATCESLRDRIDAKLQAKGVKYYSLEIRPVKTKVENTTESDKEQPKAKGEKVVGTCEDDSREIIYTKL